jgi:hypothetical protein
MGTGGKAAPLSNAQFKNDGAVPPLPHTSSWHNVQGQLHIEVHILEHALLLSVVSRCCQPSDSAFGRIGKDAMCLEELIAPAVLLA